MGATSFKGFPADGFAFLGELAANNTREWFEANRARYETSVKTPAALLQEELAGLLGAGLGRTTASKSFRLNRDVRFSADKTPYNTHVRMAFWEAGEAFAGKDDHPPSFFLSIEPDHVVIGAGMFAMPAERLARYRDRVAGDEGAELETIVRKLERDGFVIDEPERARVPAGYPKDHPRESYLRRNGVVVWDRGLAPGSLAGAAAAGKLAKRLGACIPLYEWLRAL